MGVFLCFIQLYTIKIPVEEQKNEQMFICDGIVKKHPFSKKVLQSSFKRVLYILSTGTETKTERKGQTKKVSANLKKVVDSKQKDMVY